MINPSFAAAQAHKPRTVGVSFLDRVDVEVKG